MLPQRFRWYLKLVYERWNYPVDCNVHHLVCGQRFGDTRLYMSTVYGLKCKRYMYRHMKWL